MNNYRFYVSTRCHDLPDEVKAAQGALRLGIEPVTSTSFVEVVLVATAEYHYLVLFYEFILTYGTRRFLRLFIRIISVGCLHQTLNKPLERELAIQKIWQLLLLLCVSDLVADYWYSLSMHRI